jgi:hypothetical protein
MRSGRTAHGTKVRRDPASTATSSASWALLPGIVPSISAESFGSDSISVNGQDPRNNNYMRAPRKLQVGARIQF